MGDRVSVGEVMTDYRLGKAEGCTYTVIYVVVVMQSLNKLIVLFIDLDQTSMLFCFINGTK